MFQPGPTGSVNTPATSRVLRPHAVAPSASGTPGELNGNVENPLGLPDAQFESIRVQTEAKSSTDLQSAGPSHVEHGLPWNAGPVPGHSSATGSQAPLFQNNAAEGQRWKDLLEIHDTKKKKKKRKKKKKPHRLTKARLRILQLLNTKFDFDSSVVYWDNSVFEEPLLQQRRMSETGASTVEVRQGCRLAKDLCRRGGLRRCSSFTDGSVVLLSEDHRPGDTNLPVRRMLARAGTVTWRKARLGSRRAKALGPRDMPHVPMDGIRRFRETRADKPAEDGSATAPDQSTEASQAAGLQESTNSVASTLLRGKQALKHAGRMVQAINFDKSRRGGRNEADGEANGIAAVFDESGRSLSKSRKPLSRNNSLSKSFRSNSSGSHRDFFLGKTSFRKRRGSDASNKDGLEACADSAKESEAHTYDLTTPLSLERFKRPVSVYEGPRSMVYEAVDTVQKEPVVLRRYETTDLSQAEIRRLGKEISFLERFPGAGRHHIVEYRGSFETAEHIYIVTENCTQGDLLRELTLSKDHSLSEEFVRDKVALGVVKALAFLHKHRIAHTDIKPENLFLNKSNQVKLGDLNLATDLMEGPAVHREGVVDYMAPEMIVIPGSGARTRPEAANRIRSYNEKADIWQVGILVYELLTGSPPFEAEDVNLTASLILWGEVESYPLYMSANAIDFVRQCLTKDPGARPDAVVLLRHPWLQKRQQAYSGLGNALTRTMTMRTAKVAAAKSPGESEASEKASTSAGEAAGAGDAALEGRVRGIMRRLGLLRTMPDTQTRALFDQAGTHLSEAKLAKIFSVNKGANGSP